MKKNAIVVIAMLFFALFINCSKDDPVSTGGLNDVRLKVSFNTLKSGKEFKNIIPMTKETPQNYFIGLKSAKLLGTNGTDDLVLFDEIDLSSSLVFDFTDNATTHSLLEGTEIPDGEYSSIEIEIYYLQMNISIATIDRGVESRNIRIYLSDDTETEQGLHQPGDMTQINEGIEIGWLLGEGQYPNMDPVTPRTSAYTYAGDGSSWYDFAGKSGENFGPFGDVDFMNNAPHPIYKTKVDFNFTDNNGTTLILDFNVTDCWQFEDKSQDGVFGADDLDALDPTLWHMELPEMTVTLQ